MRLVLVPVASRIEFFCRIEFICTDTIFTQFRKDRQKPLLSLRSSGRHNEALVGVSAILDNANSSGFRLELWNTISNLGHDLILIIETPENDDGIFNITSNCLGKPNLFALRRFLGRVRSIGNTGLSSSLLGC